MHKRIKKATRWLGKTLETGAASTSIRGIVSTVTIPTLLSGCAHQESQHGSDAVAGHAPKNVIFYSREAADSSEGVGAFDPVNTQAADLPASDYLIIEEIISRRAKRSEQEKLDDKKIKQALEDAEREQANGGDGSRSRKIDKNLIRAKGRLIERLRKGRSRDQSVAATTRGGVGQPLPWTGQQFSRVGKLGRDGLWGHVRNHLILASVEHERVAAQVEDFRRHPGRVTYLTRKAEPYLGHLVSEIGRKGLPLDLVIVPMVESGFEPTAVSPKAAAGLWQIIPSTGIDNGLTVSEEYDGRYDVHASTQAALRYFKHLIGLFKGDWLLALAAYNCGEGAIQRAVASNAKAGKGTSFWDLDLPAETEAYVPKIVALARMIADPATANTGTKKQAAVTRELASVELAAQVPLNDAVAASGITPEEFFRLNPAFKPDIAPPGKTYNVMLPVDKAQALAANLQGAKFLGTRTIVVKKGDTLARLAKRHGVPQIKLAEWNGLTPDTPLTPGQELLVFPV